MKKKGRKRLVLWAVLLVLFCTACGAKNADPIMGSKVNKAFKEEVTEELVPEYSYIAEYLSVPEALNLNQPAFVGNKVYGWRYDWNQEGKLKTSFVTCSLADGALGEPEEWLTFEEHDEIDRFCVDAQGNVYFLIVNRPEIPEDAVYNEAFYEEYYKNTQYHLVKYSADKELVFNEDISEYTRGTEYFYAGVFSADGNGNTCIWANGIGAILFDGNGEHLATLESGGWVAGMGRGSDGKLYCASTEYRADVSHTALFEIDFEGRTFGSELNGFALNEGNECIFAEGPDGKLIAYDQSALYEYSVEKQEMTKLLTWLDCDIDGTAVSAISYGTDGRMYALLFAYDADGMELAALKKVRMEDVTRRENLTIGVLYHDSGLARRLVEFNRKNEKYRVVMKTYLDINDWSDSSYQDAIERFTEDILSGQGPDVFDLSGLDTAALAAKGAIEDLTPYLEKSAVVNKNDIFPRILQQATYDGILAYVPSYFSLSTLAVKSSIIGDRKGWNCHEMAEFAKQYPESDIMEYGDRSTALSMMMMIGKNYFINRQSGECHFDTEEFEDVLQFAASFPENGDYSERLVPYRIQDNSLLVAMADLYSFDEIQSILAYFDGEDVTFIGYPSFGDDNGCIIIPSNSYAMSALSSQKEGAFELLESILDMMNDSDYGYFGFPTRISAFEEQRDAAMIPNYVLDENGEIILDINGNPTYEEDGVWSMQGLDGEEWMFKYHPVTEQEANIITDLLENAVMYTGGLDEELNQIIYEEAQAYFQGNKTVEETAGLIQERVTEYLKEKSK